MPTHGGKEYGTTGLNQIEMKIKNVKIEMALSGYYNTSDYARLLGLSKQAISKSDKYKRINRHGRPWYKFDNGEKGQELYPKSNKMFSEFLDFGMTQRGRSVAISTMPIEVKRISSELLSVRIYNKLGDMISILASSKMIERIDNNDGI